MDNLKEVLIPILSLFSLTEENYELTQEEDQYLINIKESESSGYLIGYHGQTIDALQYLINLMYFYKYGAWEQIRVEVGDYQAKKIQFLHDQVDKTVERVLFLKESVQMLPMNASERRVVHLYLKDNENVKTESVGEGRNRAVVISFK